MFKRSLLARLLGLQFLMLHAAEGEGGGGLEITPEIQAVIDAQVSGLKSKNAELLANQRELKDSLKRFDGIDPVAVTAMLKQFADDEEAGLLKAGKMQEVVDKRTERMKSDYEKQLKAERDLRLKSDAKAAKLADGTLAGMIGDAALKAGALPEAKEDIVLRGRGLWRLDEDGQPVAMSGDDVVLGKDGKTPLSPSEWAESLRETASHLWPKAQGGNALGSGNHNGRPGKDLSKLSPIERMNAARATT